MFLILLAVLLATLIYLKLVRVYNYWPERGVKQLKQVYVLGDQAGLLFRTESFWHMNSRLYNAFPTERYVGLYQFMSPTLMVKDREVIKRIAIKDFDHFVDHKLFVPDGIDPLWSNNLLMLKGERWHDMRSTLSPSFTSRKMKMIFTSLSECADNFTNYFVERAKGTTAVELKDVFTRYTNDAIATTAFGIKCDSLRDGNNEFYLMAKEATNFNSFWKNVKTLFLSLAPNVAKVLGFKLFSKNVANFFYRVVTETIRVRKENGIIRPDMLQLLIEARDGKLTQDDSANEIVDTGFATVQESTIHTGRSVVKKELSDLDMTAQALIFIFGGFETSSTVMCVMAYELTVNPKIQRKLQEEIDKTWNECGGTLTYEALMNMKYMDMVVSEALRLYPPIPSVDRVCVKPYTIEPSEPNEKPVHLVKGDVVWIPVHGLQRDPKFFSKPDQFDPERFNDENKSKIEPFTYLPFGLGPRNCIGSRFALMEVKIIMFYLLSKFDFAVIDKTPIPLKISRTSLNLLAEGGFWIGLKPRSRVNCTDDLK